MKCRAPGGTKQLRPVSKHAAGQWVCFHRCLWRSQRLGSTGLFALPANISSCGCRSSEAAASSETILLAQKCRASLSCRGRSPCLPSYRRSDCPADPPGAVQHLRAAANICDTQMEKSSQTTGKVCAPEMLLSEGGEQSAGNNPAQTAGPALTTVLIRLVEV